MYRFGADSPSLIFPYVDPLTGTLYSFALYSFAIVALAFVARPFGALLFMWIDRKHGRGVKLTSAFFLLGGSTAAIVFLPDHVQVGGTATVILAQSASVRASPRAVPGTASLSCSR